MFERKRGKPQRTFIDVRKEDMKGVGVPEEDEKVGMEAQDPLLRKQPKVERQTEMDGLFSIPLDFYYLLRYVFKSCHISFTALFFPVRC